MAMAFVQECTTCRICKSDGAECFETIMDLGDQVIGSRFPTNDEPDPPKAPLQLVHCNCCGLVQLKHTVSADEMYTQTYGYRSGLNATMPKHLATIVDDMMSYMKPHFHDGDVILDIGCNDSTLLQLYSRDLRGTLVGIDPTGLQFKEYYTDDILLLPTFFDRLAYAQTQLPKAKCVTSISMFYDLPNPQAFVDDVAHILDPHTGMWIMEQSYMPTMLERNSFDTICHEHLEYYALSQIQWMCERAGLRIVDVNFNDCNGGSFRVSIAHNTSVHASNANVHQIQSVLDKEVSQHFGPNDSDMTPFKEFQERCEIQKRRLQTLLTTLQRQNKKVYLYGASTKGNTLLQYYGITTEQVCGAAERNPIKYGRRTPGTNIPIMSEAEVRLENPDFFLVLPWHFRDEFLERESAYLQGGGQFIFPLPEVQIFSGLPRKKALITGIHGHIASCLAESLRENGHHVYGTSRNPQADTTASFIVFHTPDHQIVDRTMWEDILATVLPDEIYHLAAQSSSEDSIATALNTMERNATWTLLLMDILAKHQHLAHTCKFFHANSTELFKGLPGTAIVCDKHHVSQFAPITPYGIGKLAAFLGVKYYRDVVGLHSCSGILTNTESRTRSSRYVTRKICSFIQDVIRHPQKHHILYLGNLDTVRDWIHCKDAVAAIRCIMEQPDPVDAIIASGEQHTVYEWLETALQISGLASEGRWNAEHTLWVSNSGNAEIRINTQQTRVYERVIAGTNTPTYDSWRLHQLGWQPSFSLKDIVADMLK